MRSRVSIGVSALLVLALAVSPSALVPMAPPLAGPAGDSQRTALIAGAATGYIDARSALEACDANLSSINARQLMSSLGVTGGGQIVAVVDTGIDPLNPGFRASSGVSRILGWKDFTGEGLASTLGEYQSTEGTIEVAGQKLRVSSLKGLSGGFLAGIMPESIGSRVGRQTYFVVFDPAIPGRFEAVSVDTDGDMSFDSEPVLFRFDESRTSSALTVSGELSVSVVVADIIENGRTVAFGADLNGHGTALASIACASGPGSYSGVAPGASLLAVKALDSLGQGSWDSIVRGVTYALDAGADVVLVGAVPDASGEDPEWLAVQKSAESKGVPMVVPAGNRGPGIGTVTVPKSGSSTVVVGGYLPGSSRVLGLSRSQDAWYPWSSCGPRPDGSRGVDLVAPALTAAPVSGYHVYIKFAVMEGTSVSAAYVAGALALLREGSGPDQGSRNQVRVLLAVSEGCGSLPNTFPVEVGAGKLDLVGAWAAYRSGVSDSGLRVSRKWNGVVSRDGLWLSGGMVGAFPLWLDNFGPMARIINVSTTADWLRVQTDYLGVPAVSQRSTWVYGSQALEPGFYAAEVVADDPSTPGNDGRLTVSQTVPQTPPAEASPDGLTRLQFGMLAGTGYPVPRQFFEVPQSAESMSVSVASEGPGTVMSLYNPSGQLVYQDLVSGSAPVRVGLPVPGLWQIAVHRDPTYPSPAPAMSRVQVTFEGVVALDQGCSLGSQEFLLLSPIAGGPAGPLTVSAPYSDFRFRRSLALKTDSSTAIVFPPVQAGVDALTVRIGAVSGSTLRAYLYRFSDAEGKWVEVSSCSTEGTGVGQIYYPSPEAGKYVAYVEAYGKSLQLYGEIDAMMLSAGPAPGVTSGDKPGAQSPTERWTARRITVPSRGAPALKYLALRDAASSTVLGILERTSVQPAEVPVVQVLGASAGSGGAGVNTVRAWTSGGQYPLDIVLSCGLVHYQLDGGRVTVWMPGCDSLAWAFPGTRSRVIFHSGS